MAIQHYEELMVLFVNTLKDLRWATAAEEDPQGGSHEVIPFQGGGTCSDFVYSI